MRAFTATCFLALSLFAGGCDHSGRSAYPTTDQSLKLARVVLYTNGVGYFERHGEVEGNLLRLKVRKDQINDLLKSLTIVDRRTGRAVSVSMPLDPQTWANVALQTLAPGKGSLAEVLDALRGMQVVLDTTEGTIEGRVVMVERIEEEPDPTTSSRQRVGPDAPPAFGNDHKVTVMEDQELKVVRLSKVKGVTLQDGDLAMQFHRSLDAAAGEGMFQQVDISIRLDGEADHDLVVSYVVEAPMWKPTYRVVLPKDGKGKALLQAWAVVDNVSGEDWADVKMALTAGAPIAFKYDLHTPREVFREDLSQRVLSRRAAVAMGETSYEEEQKEAAPAEPAPDAEAADEDGADDATAAKDKKGDLDTRKVARNAPMGVAGGSAAPGQPPAPPRSAAKPLSKRELERGRAGGGKMMLETAEPVAAQEVGEMSLEGLRRSTLARARASRASGLTHYEIGTPVTVPDGSSTMVALINQEVDGEETFMFKPGGAGVGYENNPYRVVRFRNSSPFVLEPGPISIYSGGSFVGEGISETVGSGTSATIPFAVESGIMVRNESKSTPEELELIKIVRGTMHVERFHQVTTIWTVQAQTMKNGFTVLIRHPRAGNEYRLKVRPPGTEDLADAFLVPLKVAKGSLKGTVELVEQTPSQTTISIWDVKALELLERLLVAKNVGPEERAKLEPIVKLRREIGAVDSEMQGLTREQEQNDRRVQLHQRTLEKLAKDKSPEAARMRAESTKSLEEFSKEGDRLARELVRLEQERTRKVLQLETALETLTIEPKK